MANFKLTFYGEPKLGCRKLELVCSYCDLMNSIEIDIDGTTIYLDKSTAIKVAKTLRTEINKMEVEVNRG